MGNGKKYEVNKVGKADSSIKEVKNEEATTSKPPDLDIIEKCTGSLGRWHLMIYILISLTKFPISWNLLNIIFLAPKMEFWCGDPTDVDKCSSKCNQHEFDKSVFSNTITTQWDLVCGHRYLESLAQTLTMLATLVGNTLGGFLADKFGRKQPIIWAIVLQGASGVAVAYSHWFVLFIILRVLSALATGVVMITGFVFIMEVIGKKWRHTLGVLYQVPFILAHAIMPLISYYLRDWRHFQIAISVPGLILIVYYWIIPESPRWQLAAGQEAQATRTLQKIAKYNRLPTDPIEGDVKRYLAQKEREVPRGESHSVTALDLIRTPTLRIYTIILWLDWFFCGLAFYGASQFVGQLGGNVFVNVGIAGIIQLPAVILCSWLVGAWGRKKTSVMGCAISGVALVMVAFLPKDPSWLKPVIAGIGACSAMCVFAALYVHSGEIFPTVLRNTGVGSCSTSARIGSMVAPFIATSSVDWLAPFCFGAGMLLGAGLTLKLPETNKEKLPETVEDVEMMGKG